MCACDVRVRKSGWQAPARHLGEGRDGGRDEVLQGAFQRPTARHLRARARVCARACVRARVCVCVCVRDVCARARAGTCETTGDVMGTGGHK